MGCPHCGWETALRTKVVQQSVKLDDAGQPLSVIHTRKNKQILSCLNCGKTINEEKLVKDEGYEAEAV